jgi:hypothetical protein
MCQERLIGRALVLLFREKQAGRARAVKEVGGVGATWSS